VDKYQNNSKAITMLNDLIQTNYIEIETILSLPSKTTTKLINEIYSQIEIYIEVRERLIYESQF
jgi:hypothetical protein